MQKNTFIEAKDYSSEKIPYQADQCLYGYFQSWNHFHHHRLKLLEIFAPSAKIENDLQHKYHDLLVHPNTVAVHVRTFDKLSQLFGYFPFLGLNYYEQAMNLFSEEALFVVFSDRINWCKHHFSQFNKNIVFI